MFVNRLRILVCAAFAGFAAMFGANAQATQYGVVFDPPPLDVQGIMKIDVDPSCLVPFPSPSNACAFDVLSVNFTDGLGRAWDIAGPDPGIGTAVSVDASQMLTGVQVDIFNLQPVGFDSNCDGTHLSFALNGFVSFNCGGVPDASSTGSVTSITKVPEPATLALLGAGFAAIGVARRRRR